MPSAGPMQNYMLELHCQLRFVRFQGPSSKIRHLCDVSRQQSQLIDGMAVNTLLDATNLCSTNSHPGTDPTPIAYIQLAS